MVDSRAQINKARLGGLRRIELYGNPGTAEGRSKGGKKTVSLFRKSPLLAKKRGFIIRKEIKYPEKSLALAEFIGIMLGDGGLPGNHQIKVSFNVKTDSEYASYICKLIRKLFLINYHIHRRRKSNGADIVVSSSNLVDFLVRQGLRTGHKVKNQICVPAWINEKLEYQKVCLRGLMDTDGGLYLHTYKSNGKTYTYLKLGFTNCSKPLLHFVFDVLKKLNYKPCLSSNNLSICSESEVKKYFAEIGTTNPKHLNKFKDYFAN